MSANNDQRCSQDDRHEAAGCSGGYYVRRQFHIFVRGPDSVLLKLNVTTTPTRSPLQNILVNLLRRADVGTSSSPHCCEPDWFVFLLSQNHLRILVRLDRVVALTRDHLRRIHIQAHDTRKPQQKNAAYRERVSLLYTIWSSLNNIWCYRLKPDTSAASTTTSSSSSFPNKTPSPESKSS